MTSNVNPWVAVSVKMIWMDALVGGLHQSLASGAIEALVEAQEPVGTLSSIRWEAVSRWRTTRPTDILFAAPARTVAGMSTAAALLALFGAGGFGGWLYRLVHGKDIIHRK